MTRPRIASHAMAIGLVVLALAIAGLQWGMHSSPAAAASGITPTPETDSENHAEHFTPFATAETGDITRLANPYTSIPTRLRLDVITYTVEAGDTPTGIAAKFNRSSSRMVVSRLFGRSPARA